MENSINTRKRIKTPSMVFYEAILETLLKNEHGMIKDDEKITLSVGEIRILLSEHTKSLLEVEMTVPIIKEASDKTAIQFKTKKRYKHYKISKPCEWFSLEQALKILDPDNHFPYISDRRGAFQRITIELEKEKSQ